MRTFWEKCKKFFFWFSYLNNLYDSSTLGQWLEVDLRKPFLMFDHFWYSFQCSKLKNLLSISTLLYRCFT